MEQKLYVSSSPHLRGGVTTSRLMWMVVAALTPAAGWSVYLFGMASVSVIVSTVFFCVAFEALVQVISKKTLQIKDGSAILSGLILALSLPPGLSIGICAVGAFAAMVIAKGFFGGLGQNPFNPAMTGRVFLLVAFPQPMTQWIAPAWCKEDLFQIPVTALDSAGKVVEAGSAGVDVITAATPLGILVEYGAEAITEFVPNQEILIGRCNGSLGEMSVLFLLIGGLFLLLTKVITWHIPVSCLATVALFGALFGFGEFSLQGAAFHLFTGAAVFGAFFIATDYVTSPLHPLGKIIFGAGVGIFTMVIRLWAGYPEGVSFAVLLMNATVPLIDRFTKPKKFGFRKLAEEGGK